MLFTVTQSTKADRLFQVSTTNNWFSAVKSVRKQLLVVESVRESTTSTPLVVEFLRAFHNQQPFFPRSFTALRCLNMRWCQLPGG